ncbi:MAG: hypothetical protein A3D67_03470 [Candidatus Lloydbacteria bacterium RIFCSPHIGHO2_02_FULL_51_22]|uniref:Uncharacterized protein n=2 Tax=Candidatus Lloydiibacteriota TaxID=1817910 RepID=A0A1G2D9B8_9BACT|nr:MAG: hypothetical protein A3D67_03470 [Candidatus Lloydbacteria bacterium RIFCSPHIGHO2_02_FULL_51_22]OGZ17090.1 MAG: hypothetical protein A3G11_01975 [Candidatus Lloydbacteria bacterium RIFCSPLOWO2_12_FULL_51_9]
MQYLKLIAIRSDDIELEKRVNSWCAWAGDAIEVKSREFSMAGTRGSLYLAVIIWYVVREGRALPTEGNPEEPAKQPEEEAEEAKNETPGVSCAHGQCTGHDSHWEEQKKEWRVVTPRLSFILRLFSISSPLCCGKSMDCVLPYISFSCTRCGATKEEVGVDCPSDEYLHRCSCCGKTSIA